MVVQKGSGGQAAAGVDGDATIQSCWQEEAGLGQVVVRFISADDHKQRTRDRQIVNDAPRKLDNERATTFS